MWLHSFSPKRDITNYLYRICPWSFTVGIAILTLKILGGGQYWPPNMFFSFFSRFSQKIWSETCWLLFFYIFTGRNEEKTGKNIAWGSRRWICQPKVMKNQKFKIDILKKNVKQFFFVPEKRKIFHSGPCQDAYCQKKKF